MPPMINSGKYLRITVTSLVLQLLQLHHTAIVRTGLVKLRMGSHCQNFTLVNEHNFIHLLNRGNPVGNQDCGLSTTGVFEIFQNHTLGFGVIQTLSRHLSINGAIPYSSICSLPSRPNSFSTSSSTGKP